MDPTLDEISSIVVIDDDDPIRHFVGTMAQHALRIKVHPFGDAREALQFIIKNREEHQAEPVDAVLCDIRMPGMTGHEFLLELRSAGLDIPVVFLSGYLDEETLTHALRLGAFDVLAKPLSPTVMVPTMEIALSVGRRRRLMWQQLFNMKTKLSESQPSPELIFEIRRAIEHVEQEHRMISLLALRNHSLKTS